MFQFNKRIITVLTVPIQINILEYFIQTPRYIPNIVKLSITILIALNINCIKYLIIVLVVDGPYRRRILETFSTLSSALWFPNGWLHAYKIQREKQNKKHKRFN